MAGVVSDEAFARAAQQGSVVSYDDLEAARAVQAESANKGVIAALAEVLIQQGVITAKVRENIEKRAFAQQAGGLLQLGPYKLIKKLGEGGMGAVYLADDLNVGRKVAVKVLPKKNANDPEFLTRFRREAKAAGALNHVNIVAAYTTGEDMGHHYLAMEYCEGDPLDKVLKRDGRLPWDKALEIISQVAAGLKHAHAHGFIHRDIKPGNIFICAPLGSTGILPVARENTGETPVLQEGFVAKILDLGLSKNVGEGEQSFVTQTNVALGTPHYISPEQAKGHKDLDGRTDIYSLGATFYHLVTGQTPFRGSTSAIIMAQHINQKLPNPQDLIALVPDGVVQVIQKMMAKKPEDRYRDCEELLDDLELLKDGKRPSSQALDTGKSSVAMRLSSHGLPSRDRKGVVPLAHARGAETAARDTRKHEPEAQSGKLRHSGTAEPALNGTPVGKYIAIGVAVLGALVVILALGMSGGRDESGYQAVSTPSTPSIPSTQSTADAEAATKLKAEETRLKNEAARLEEERHKLADDKRKAEEALLVAEAAAKKKTEEAAKTQPVPPLFPATPAKTDTAAVDDPAAKEAERRRSAIAAKPDEPPKVVIESSADKAAWLFQPVLKELAQLLKGNKFSDALALLNAKLKAPAFADAPDVVKREIADIEAVMELRQAALDALRKQVGRQVTLKKGSGVISGKVKDDPKSKGLTLGVGGPEIVIPAEGIHVEDIDANAPKQPNAADDARRRGIMYLYADNLAKAKEYFTKPQTLNPEPYLDRIAALELGEIETAALKAWEKAEKLFAAKDLKGAKAAYEVFERDHGRTQTAKTRAATVRERCDSIEKALGPPQELALDLGGGVKVELLLIPAGTFMMGSPDNEPGRDGDGREGPQHEVTITKPFYMGKYDVTVAQFRRFAESAKYQTECERSGNKGFGWDNGWKELMGVNWMKPNFPQEDNHPVCLISWNDAQAFVSWAAKATGKTVRLPTEAEWEYACRAKTTTRFYFGQEDKDLDKAGWFEGNSEHMTHPVGQKAPNAWGLYDMLGNVWQWCQDRYQKDYYKDSPSADPPGPRIRNERVVRGGSWLNNPKYCRAAGRFALTPDIRGSDDGFRLVVLGSSRTP